MPPSRSHGLASAFSRRKESCLRVIVCAGIVLIALTYIAFTATAVNKLTLTWQPITPEDLALKDNPADPGEDAMMLYHEVLIDSLTFSTLEYKRIKIFTESGRKWADVSIPYIPGHWEIKDLQARTIQPDGKIIDFDGKVFEELLVKTRGIKIVEKKFSLPSVQPGCIVEYMFREVDNAQYEHEGDWQVQNELYTRLGVYSFRPSPFLALNWRRHRLPATLKPEKQPDGTIRLEIKDVPGLKTEEYMPPDKVVREGISFYYSFKPATTPDQFWKDVGEGTEKGIDQRLKKKKYLDSVLAATVGPDDPPEVKLRKLYERVQQITNLDYEKDSNSKRKQMEKLRDANSIDDMMKLGAGESAEINLAFLGLARAAGFDAASVFLATRDEDFFVPALQDWNQLNDNVIWVHIGSQDVYLDPGNPFYPYGSLPWYVTGGQGMRVRTSGVDFVTVTPPRSSDYVMAREAQLKLEADGSLSGKLRVELKDDRARSLREMQRDNEDSARDKDLTDTIKGWLPADATFEMGAVTGWDKTAPVIRAEGTIRIPNFTTVAGKHTLLSTGIFTSKEEMAFQSSTRVNDIYFDYPFENRDTIEIEIPAGLRVEELPPPKKDEQPSLQLQVHCAENGTRIQVDRQLTVSQFLFAVKSYSHLRAFFSAAASADQQEIVLSPR